MEIAEKIYLDLGHILPSNIEKYKADLYEIDKISFLVFNIKKYDKNYCEGLFLSVPELWSKLHPNDWVQLSMSLCPRPSVENIKDLRNLDMGSFYDLLFVSNFLKINLIDLLISNDLLSNQEKFKILNYASYYIEFFFVEKKVILEDLREFYKIDYVFFEKITANLHRKGMPKMFDTKINFLDYIKKELLKIK